MNKEMKSSVFKLSLLLLYCLLLFHSVVLIRTANNIKSNDDVKAKTKHINQQQQKTTTTTTKTAKQNARQYKSNIHTPDHIYRCMCCLLLNCCDVQSCLCYCCAYIHTLFSVCQPANVYYVDVQRLEHFLKNVRRATHKTFAFGFSTYINDRHIAYWRTHTRSNNNKREKTVFYGVYTRNRLFI